MAKETLQPLLHERCEQANSEHAAVSRRRTKFSCNGDSCGLSGAESRPEDVEARSAAIRKLGIATGLCLLFMAVEVAGGLIANSLAVLTDAAHLLSDVAGFAISLFAIWAASWEATPRQTYGFFRLEILGALMSIQIIWLLTGILVYEAIYRICHTSQQVDGRLMFIVACFGFCVNLIMLLLLGHHGHSHGNSHDHGHHRDHNDDHLDHNDDHDHDHDHVEASGNEEPGAIYVSHSGHQDSGHEHTCHSDEPDVTVRHGHQKCGGMIPGQQSRVNWDVEKGSTSKGCANESNINVRGAYLHALGDLIQSIGVMIGGAVIWAKPNWKIVDLICTLLFSLLVLCTTIKMLRDIVEILMESTPRGIDSNSLTKGLLNISGVTAVHEMHIWSITMGKTLLACHITIDSDADADAILKEALHFCESTFKISHVTVQIERNCSS